MKETQRITGGELIQTRASKTRQKILVTALKTYSEKGYHDTTVDEIARAAGLSVGTAYRYFKDKKELLLAALEYGFSYIADFADIKEVDILKTDITKALIKFEEIHHKYFDIHEELEGLRHTDSDVAKLYNDFTERALKELYEKFPDMLKTKPHSFEDLRIAIGVMENHCHYCMNFDPDKATRDYMREQTCDLVKYILYKS
ncbi:MAG: TetR/AcrR family transcriptional regulator [Clostridiales bacterium]|nr:TetR/AcrR family transcriptional regulator [Clostridiales bacterium]